MNIEPYVRAIQADLAAVATGDAATEAVAQRMGRALELALPLRWIDATGEAATELSGQLEGAHVEVRVAGRDVALVYVSQTAAAPPPAAAPTADEGDTARLTLRLPEGLKARVEQAAGREGQSVNQWLVRVIARSLEGPPEPRVVVGRRVSGFGRG